MNQTSILTLLLFFALVSAQSCHDPAQKQGSCAKCSSQENVLVQGYCYAKIDGCQIYGLGPKCLICSNGYILTDQKCARESVQFNSGTPVLFVQNNPSNLSSQQIRKALIQSYGTQFLALHDYFKSKNSHLTTVQKTERVKGVRGQYISIIFNSAENKQFIGWAEITSTNKILNPQLQQLLDMPTDLVTAVKLVRNLVQVQNYGLFQVKQGYIIDFIDQSEKWDVVRVSIDRRQMRGITEQNLRQKIQIHKLEITDIGLQEIVSLYPYLDPQTAISTDKDNGFFTYFFGALFSVSVHFREYRFTINTPLASRIALPADRDGWNELIEFSEAEYKEITAFVRVQKPELSGLKDIYVQKNQNRGLYRIVVEPLHLVVYQVTVHPHPPSIASIQFYAIVSPTSPYNYNQDNIFFQAYASLFQILQFVKIPSILTVQMKESSGQTYFKVTYSDTEYMQFIIKGKQVHLIAYYRQNANLLHDSIPSIIQLSFPEPIVVDATVQKLIQAYPNCSGSNPEFRVLTSDSPNLIDSLLYDLVVAAVRKYRDDWAFITPILILVSEQSIQAYADDYRSLYKVLLKKKQPSVQVIGAKLLTESTGKSIFNTEAFPYASLIIPKGVFSTASAIKTAKQIAAVSETSLPSEIINPEIMIASRFTTENYRLLITTDKSPKDFNHKYFIQYDAIITKLGFVTFYDAKKVMAKHVYFSNCGSYSVDGQCLDCSQQQISYGGHCFEKIEKCQNQALGLCLHCRQDFKLAGNSCEPVCL